MSETVPAFFVGFMLCCSLLIISGMTPKHINQEWEKKLIEKGLGEYVVETVNDKPVIKFQFNDK